MTTGSRYYDFLLDLYANNSHWNKSNVNPIMELSQAAVNLTNALNLSSNKKYMESFDALDQWNASYESCVAFIFYTKGLLALIFCIVGIIGNMLSLWVLAKVGRTSAVLFLLKVLAVVETLYLIFFSCTAVLGEFQRHFLKKYYIGYTAYILMAVFPLASMSLTLSIWLVTLVTIHRYLAVCHAYRKDSTFSSIPWVKVQTLIVGLFAIGLDVPRYFEVEVKPHDYHKHLPNSTDIEMTLEHTNLWKNMTYQLVMKTILMIVFRKAIPLLVTAILTGFLVRALIRRENIRNTSLRGPGRTSSFKSNEDSEVITRVLIVIASVFVVCQTPMMISSIIRVAAKDTSLTCRRNTYYMRFVNIADLLVIINAAINCFIYYPFIPMFRSRLHAIFKGNFSLPRAATWASCTQPAPPSPKTGTRDTLIMTTVATPLINRSDCNGNANWQRRSSGYLLVPIKKDGGMSHHQSVSDSDLRSQNREVATLERPSGSGKEPVGKTRSYPLSYGDPIREESIEKEDSAQDGDIVLPVL